MHRLSAPRAIYATLNGFRLLESLDVERSIQLPESSEIGPIDHECSQIQCSDRDCGSPFWVGLPWRPIAKSEAHPICLRNRGQLTYLRAPWELDGPLNIGVCLEEGPSSFDDAYGTLGALNQSFWTIFVLKNLYTHFTQVLVSSKKSISIYCQACMHNN